MIKLGLHKEKSKCTLHEAMIIVLEGKKNRTMPATSLADEIYNKRLYLREDGAKAQSGQICARGSRYPRLFECLPDEYIKLKSVI